MKLYITSLLLSITLLISCGNQDKKKMDRPNLEKANIMFYNVENLFDTIDQPNTIDEEFLASSEKNWNSERYNYKLQQLTKVIVALDSSKLPDIIGLCEVENKGVVDDLIHTKKLHQEAYKIIHQDSPDARGIDVALVHNNNFTPIHTSFLNVIIPDDPPTTRDILYSKGILANDTLHIFVNHWPSRWGGKEESAPKRAAAAMVLKNKIDSIQSTNQNARIIIMGDFNDHPDDESLFTILNAKPFNDHLGDLGLINLAWDHHVSGNGTYNYRGNWGCLDQFIVSESLFNSGNLRIDSNSFETVRKEWLLYTNDKGEKYPSRSYGGPNYYGGFSDHLAIILHLNQENN